MLCVPMKIYEQYRKNPRNLRASTIRESAREILKGAFHDPGNDLCSSVTLPVWQAARLRKAVRILKDKGVKAPQTEIFSKVIRLMHRKARRLNCQVHRTRRRNTKEYSYQKISLTWPQEDYNLLHGRADHVKVSASYLLDIALRLYLETALAIILGEGVVRLKLKRKSGNQLLEKVVPTASLCVIAETTGIYQRETRVSTPWMVEYSIILGGAG